MRLTGLITISALLVLMLSLGSPFAAAQDAGAGDAPVVDPAADTSDEPRKGRKFGLYVFAATGSTDVDPIDVSTSSASTNTTFSEITFEGMAFGQAAIGWRLPERKGDFRLVFSGYKEEGYHFHSEGSAAVIDPALMQNAAVQDNLLWWTVDIVDGALTSVRTPPQWSLANDANTDGFVDIEEVFYTGPDIMATTSVVPDLENRMQTVDAVFGNTFGPERVTATWWAGLRYFVYEGTLLSGAWLSTQPPGEFFTDGVFSAPLQFRHEATGYGPTTSIEIDLNFFHQRVSLFAKGGAAFLFEKLESESAPFTTWVLNNATPVRAFPIAGQISAERDKSIWHTHLEGGIRVSLKNGLRLEAAYQMAGFLDAVLMPTTLRIPLNTVEAPFGTSATFKTTDFVFDGWRAGVGFQF